MLMRDKLKVGFAKVPEVTAEANALIGILVKLVQQDTSELYTKSKLDVPSPLATVLEFSGERTDVVASRENFESHGKALLERLESAPAGEKKHR